VAIGTTFLPDTQPVCKYRDAIDLNLYWTPAAPFNYITFEMKIYY